MINTNNYNEHLPLSEQREEILQLNPDLVFGVYSINSQNINGYSLKLLNNCLTCYPNQLENLKGLEKNSDVTIINLGALRKGNIEVISGEKSINISNPVLLSNGVLDYIEGESFESVNDYKKRVASELPIDVLGTGLFNFSKDINGNYNDNVSYETYKIKRERTINKHFITTLRDGGAADNSMRTTTAGRNTGEDLNEEIEVELMGEAPFFGKNKEGEYILAVHDISNEKINFLEEAVNNFISMKYLKKGDENYEGKKELFERNFKGVKYDKLGTILEDILVNKRFVKYDLLDGNIAGTEDGVKNIKLGKSSGDYYVYHDKENNTIEYRAVKKIGNFDESFVPLGKRPGRLYLESENQYARVPRIKNAGKNRGNISQLVPTVQDAVDKVIENNKK